ncbi:hypothetical protein SAMN04488096_109129 [Mesonia phycicola]|uniref:Uncharacterized protein n=1 Tax=Mesonia phycicola TaxID=579105 RepID=A0A1M6H4V2_9FLAO|nr:bacteriocin fulvocin C-related protein [Mesonia phycicola]SHJ17287.1 hypothetical protein SAMN04488096_109129 [Mesonia phycicola]
MITDFQENYSAAEKSLIWDYKYKRLLAESDGSFTDNQIQLINEIKTLVSEEDFFATPETYEVEELEDISLEVFSAEESAFLFYSLENKDGDITVNPTTGEPVTDCFWCYQEIPGGTSGPCEAIVDSDGDILGFTRDNVQVDKVRFFIFRTETTINGVPCGFNDWVAGGMQIRD